MNTTTLDPTRDPARGPGHDPTHDPNAAALAGSHARQRRRWFGALLLVTLLPLLGLPLLSLLELPFRQSLVIGIAVFVGGVCHVASTLTFYADRDARQLMGPMKTRFIALPLLALAITVAAVAVGRATGNGDGPLGQAVMALFFVHLVWLYYHYQKQNYGLMAFAAAGSGTRLPLGTVKLVLLPPLAGGLATIPALLTDGLGLPLPAWLTAQLPLLRGLAWLVYGVAALLMLRQVARHAAVFRQPLVAAFTLASFAFFLPALLVRNLDYAFWSYALAHGFQYLLMVGLVSRRARRPLAVLPLFVLAALVGGWLLNRLGGNHALFVSGILLTWVHFALDARLWRMSDAPVRNYLRGRFAFVFER